MACEAAGGQMDATTSGREEPVAAPRLVSIPRRFPSPEVRLVQDAHAVNGERPGWDDLRRTLYWVDMRAPALNAYHPETGERRSWEMPAWIGCFAIFRDGRLAVALRTGLDLFDPESGVLRPLAPAPYDIRRFCFNDGRCDRQGRLIVGPMLHALAPADADGSKTAPLWRFDGRRRAMVPLNLPPVQISNGLAFSPDGKALYHSDTPAKTIWVCDYDPASGAVANQRVFARVEEGGDEGGPDGATVDSEGCYICAVFGAGCLLRFDPAGKLERRIDLPVRYPTMPALGGDDHATLFVTSASYPRNADRNDPAVGGLLALEAPAPGLPTSYMAPLEGAPA
jgi:sugar lactone lactonase YvrE